MMVSIYTHVYKLRELNKTENGQLFKNENVFNLIMSYMFKRTKIKSFLRKIIVGREEFKIKKFTHKLAEVHMKGPQYFGVPVKLCLGKEKRLILNNSNSRDSDECTQIPYFSCIRMVEELCIDSQTPITKLKFIMAISKEIMAEINRFYKKENLPSPDLDPDSIMSIIIYIIARANNPLILEEMKMVEYFTTTNCMNSISGFYLQTFNAAIESILTI